MPIDPADLSREQKDKSQSSLKKEGLPKEREILRQEIKALEARLEKVKREEQETVEKPREEERIPTKEKKIKLPEERREPYTPTPEELIKEEVPQEQEQPRPTPQIITKVAQIQKMAPDDQVKVLLNIADKKGVSDAIDIARYLGSAYVLDEFHDKLVAKIQRELKELYREE